MAAAVLPRWDPHNYNDDSAPSDAPYFETSLLIIEDIDDNGNTVVVIDDYYKTVTATIPAASPLPSAATTSDPHGLLQKQQAIPSTAPPSSTTTNPFTSSSATAQAESKTSSSPSPTPTVADTKAAPTSTPQQDQPKDHNGLPPIGAMVVAPIAVIAAVIAFFVFWRKRRAARRNGNVTHEKIRSPEDGLSRGPPGYNESTNGLLMTPAAAATPLTARTANNSLGASASRPTGTSQQAPVILNTNMSDGAYFTGIDTSDAVSLASGAPNAAGEPRRSFEVSSITSADEPPPPYRPRSVPPISRETSLRNPTQGLAVDAGLAAATLERLSHGGRRDADDDDDDEDVFLTPTPETAPMRNPFDDPEDENEDANGGGITPTQSPRWSRRRAAGDEDARSMISEFSFEHEHR